MGIITSRFRRKLTTKEVLASIQKDVEHIEEYRQNAELRHKRLIWTYTIYSTGLCLVALAVCFFYLPYTYEKMFYYGLGYISLCLVLYFAKSVLSWFYSRKIKSSDKKLHELYKRKQKILEDVMETETYKVAKEILEMYAADRKGLALKTMVTPAQPVSHSPIHVPVSDVRRRLVPTPALTTPVLQPPRMYQLVSQIPPASLLYQSAGTPAPLRIPVTASRMQQPRNMPGASDVPPGPPMPRPILPRERGVLDHFIEFLVGDGPSNRYALICRQCESHNGMALREEFEYLSFRCAYCYYWNPARKQRPQAPKLENLMDLAPPPPVAENESSESDGENTKEKEEKEGSEVKDTDGEKGSVLKETREEDEDKERRGTESDVTADSSQEVISEDASSHEGVDDSTSPSDEVDALLTEGITSSMSSEKIEPSDED